MTDRGRTRIPSCLPKRLNYVKVTIVLSESALNFDPNLVKEGVPLYPGLEHPLPNPNRNIIKYMP